MPALCLINLEKIKESPLPIEFKNDYFGHFYAFVIRAPNFKFESCLNVLIFNTDEFAGEILMPRHTSVTLGDHFVSNKISEGIFQSVSEAVRAGLRRLEEDEIKLEALRIKLKEGEESPLVEDFSPQNFIDSMRKKTAN